ncbi:MAG: hypothetical protein ACREBU_26265, partial [Nitrososphaera sp.]
MNMQSTSANDRLWELERRVFQLSTLFEVAQTLAACRDSESIYSGVLAILSGTFGVGLAAAFSRDRENGRWRCFVSRSEYSAENLNARLQEIGANNLEQIRHHIQT